MYGDAMVEILSSLSVKNLLRFKCVCKSWYSLIENPSFVSKHLKNVSTRLIVVYMDEDDGTDEYYHPTDLSCMFPDETLADLSVQDLDHQQPATGVLGGPYDGIYCIFGLRDRITLWNVATRDSRTLPNYGPTCPPNTKVYKTSVGFGLDPKHNDYKLIMIYTFWDERTTELHEFSLCTIYNLRINSWRDLVCFKTIHYCIPHSHGCTYLDGLCHWLWELEDSKHKIIISFDMANEVFQEVQCPDIASSAYMETLDLYHDSLSLLFLNTTNNHYEIWVLKERIWSKHLSVTLLGVEEPLGVWKNGGFFVQSDSRPRRLLLYDPNTQEMRDLGLRSFWFSVYNFKESLIPVKGVDSFSDI